MVPPEWQSEKTQKVPPGTFYFYSVEKGTIKGSFQILCHTMSFCSLFKLPVIANQYHCKKWQSYLSEMEGTGEIQGTGGGDCSLGLTTFPLVVLSLTDPVLLCPGCDSQFTGMIVYYYYFYYNECQSLQN